MTTRTFPTSGDYVVTNSFAISAGCWKITFKQGTKLQWDEATKKLQRFSEYDKEWVNVTPPIHSETDFSLPFRLAKSVLQQNLKAVTSEPVELTLAEIEKMLGYKVKII
jgi:hypothetical protein